MKRCVFIIFCCLITSLLSYSQNIEIKGRVLDNENNVLEGASIAIYKQGSIFVTGTISDAKGNFAIKNMVPDRYKIMISFVGFVSENIEIDNLSESIDLNTISLESTNQLDEVVVIGSSKRYEVNKQIIIPTKSLVDISNNAWSLMKNMQLSRILVNPMNNEITTQDGDNVILQINGVQVSKEEIMALKSKDIIRVEYLDQPGVRYQVGAVINYLVRKREQGGYITVNANQSISSLGIRQYSLTSNYNWNKSQLGVIVGYDQVRSRWTRENEYNYIFPTEEFFRKEEGLPVMYDDKKLNASVKYTLSEPDKYLFSATFRNNLNHVPNQFSDRMGYTTSSNSDKTTFFQDYSTWKENTPSLELYYQQNLKNKQLLIFNVVGTLINSKSTHLYQEIFEKDSSYISNIYSAIDGKKRSIIVEGIYEKTFENNNKLSIGARHNQSYTNNKYVGDANSDVNMNFMESYLFADYIYSKNRFSFNLGLSGKYTYYKQGDNDYNKINIQPRFQVQYSFQNNTMLRYHIDMASSAPSLSDLNDIEQQIDTWQLKRGNPSLRNSVTYNQNILFGYNNKYIDVELMGFYNYTHKPIFETIFYEDNKVINTIENQKNWQRIRIQSTLNIHPLGQYVSLSVTPIFNRFLSHGNNYTHTYSNWLLRASLVASYKRWFLNAQMTTRNNVVMGETIVYGENFHMIEVGYNTDKWNVSTGVFMPFMKNYSQATRNMSTVASNYSEFHTMDLHALFYVSASINLDFGHTKKAQKQKVSNQDSGSGILSTGKRGM